MKLAQGRRIAVVGGGISGLVAAYLLHPDYHVTLFEANDYIGGHTRTLEVEQEGRSYAVDTGFIVFNEPNYPQFNRLLQRLGVASQPTQMGFSVKCGRTGLEYASTPLSSLLAQRRNALRPSFYRMLADILRFNREAPELLRDPNDATTLGDYLADNGYSKAFVQHHIIPLGSALWSALPDRMYEFPARYFVQFFANHAFLQVRERDWARLAAPARVLAHALNRNTLRGSRRNIAAHYDLSNDFFRLFLDDNMMYSSAVFPRPDSSLEEASRYKVDRICKKLALVPEDHLLEIGTGWGGFALHAAREYGCRVTTATISQQQYELARQRVRAAGLDGRVEVVLADYRHLQGQYDKLVSIEMIEAVGHHYFDTYFGCCARLLKPEGLMLLQAIVIGDWAYERARRSVDFIKAYIFPGSCIPSVATISRSLAAATDMRLVHLEDIGPHYARTLRAWRTRFWDAEEQVRQLGFTEGFIRMWDFYFAYCIGGFEERYISDVQCSWLGQLTGAWRSCPRLATVRFRAMLGVLVYSLPVAMAGMAALYWLQRRRGDAGVVDVGWAGGIGLVAVAAACSGDGWEPRRLLLGLMGAVWSFRLTAYLVIDRLIRAEEEC